MRKRYLAAIEIELQFVYPKEEDDQKLSILPFIKVNAEKPKISTARL